VLKRSWQVGGHTRHHLIDPATGAPSTSDVALATVIGGDAWTSEVLAKAVLLRGVDRAFDLLDGAQAGLVVGHDGVVHVSTSFVNFSGGVVPESPIPFDQTQERS
jgi:FAD:protein FMN transferase